jgi:peptide chain release factor 2
MYTHLTQAKNKTIMYENEKEKLAELEKSFTTLVHAMDIDAKEARLKVVAELTSAADLWNTPDRARSLLQEQQRLTKLIHKCHSINRSISELNDFISLAADEVDESVAKDIQKELMSIEKNYTTFEFMQTLSGELDPNNAYLTIHAGAGGTEACDWVDMLLRMYTRWSEAHGMSVKTIDFLDGEEAGYRYVTILVSGDYAYGYLKTESGVHRLVRISPFDSNSRRHTSFASVDVIAEITDDIEIEINENDLRIDTYRASGAGGQHVNVTDSAVRITHEPSGIVVACQNERSQHKNRSTAMKMLKAKLYEIEIEEREKKASQEYADKNKIEWGSQIRSYVLHPYNLVKDLRTDTETSNTTAVLDGDIDTFISTYLRKTARGE